MFDEREWMDYYRIGRRKRWTCRVEHMVDRVDRSTCCLDYFQPMRILSPMEWIDSRARHFVFSLPFRMTMATGGTNLCRTNAVWYFWWCAVGKWIRQCRSNGYRLWIPNVANIRHHCICRWYRTAWYHSLQRKWWQYPEFIEIIIREKKNTQKYKN